MPRSRWLAGVAMLMLVAAIAWAKHQGPDASPQPVEQLPAPANAGKPNAPLPRTVIPGGRATLPPPALIVVPYSNASQPKQFSATFFGRIGAWLCGGQVCATSDCAVEAPALRDCGYVMEKPVCTNVTKTAPICETSSHWWEFFTKPWYSRNRDCTSGCRAQPLCSNKGCTSPTARACDSSYRKGPLPQPSCDSYSNGNTSTAVSWEAECRRPSRLSAIASNRFVGGCGGCGTRFGGLFPGVSRPRCLSEGASTSADLNLRPAEPPIETSEPGSSPTPPSPEPLPMPEPKK